MKNFFLSLVLTLSSFAFSQEQFNPNLIIDLTEQQALERYKSSNVRKALKLKIKDFNYKQMIQNTQTDKLSDIIILNSTDDKNIIKLLTTLDKLKEIYPYCTDCYIDTLMNLEDAKQLGYGSINYDFIKDINKPY